MKCSVLGCGLCQSKNRPNLTFHRFPKNDSRKREWLEKIGQENIRPGIKNVYICSLHFEESSFNKTLDVIRLKDDAVPRIFTKKNHPSQVQLGENLSTAITVTMDCPQPSTSSDSNAGPYPLSLVTDNEQRPSTSTFSHTEQTQKEVELMSALQELKKLEERVVQQRKKNKVLNETIRRQKLKLNSFQSIIIELKEKEMINNETSMILHQCGGSKDFLQRQILKSKGLPLPKQYSEEIRKFALTLHFYSPKVYEFIRTTYESCLPHPRTLSKWYQSVDAAPGFCQEAFTTLETKVKLSTEPVICALVIDEMSIRKSLIWDPRTRQYHGRVNTGSNIDCDDVKVATQTLVFLLNCVNGKWKLPVAYFFITSLSGEQKAALLLTCLHKCFEIALHVVSVTCDGPASNISMFEHLGCNLFKMEKTFFIYEGYKIYAFIDPCHALKLVRNTFGDRKILYDSMGGKIDFNLLEKLVNLQENETMHLGTKITKAHIYFTKQKMKVRLATQLLSESVADALQYCSRELCIEGFENCEGTILFIRTMNNVFDVLNSYSVRPPGWKKVDCLNNYGLVEALFEKSTNYIKGLKFSDGTLVVESQRKTGFIGLIIDMKSAFELFLKVIGRF